MIRLLLSVTPLTVFCVTFALHAAEKGFVHFETRRIVATVPRGQEALFGKIVNERHPANELEPMAVGNFWLYESRTNGDGQGFADTYVVRISKQVKHNDEPWYEYKIGDEVKYYLRRGDAAVYSKSGDKQPHKWISRKPIKGETYTNEGGTFTVTETEELVDSLWGKLKCVELVHVHDQDVEDDQGVVTGKKKVKDIYWYHRGIGVIAIIGEDGRDSLIGYNVSNNREVGGQIR